RWCSLCVATLHGGHVGSPRECTRILGLHGYRVHRLEWDADGPRARAVMRAFGRGKRWLLLRRWKTVRGSKRGELQQLFAANRRLFKAYVLREQLDRLWTYKTRPGVLNFLNGWINALRWQRLPEMANSASFCFV